MTFSLERLSPERLSPEVWVRKSESGNTESGKTEYGETQSGKIEPWKIESRVKIEISNSNLDFSNEVKFVKYSQTLAPQNPEHLLI